MEAAWKRQKMYKNTMEKVQVCEEARSEVVNTTLF